ncbi:uncharacterized protein [Clytia hemisphaerica]|uniref:Uncharacterized protein n=1 Tax=Clytia hemisphaerica TaxID=252671 RepID=A0A7M5WY75_9CNID
MMHFGKLGKRPHVRCGETQIASLTDIHDPDETNVRKENENIVCSSPLVVQEFPDDKNNEESTTENVNYLKIGRGPDRENPKVDSQKVENEHDATLQHKAREATSPHKRQKKNLVSMDSLDTDIQSPRSRKNSFSDLQKEAVQKIKRKTSNLVAPNNHDIVVYCKTLINVSFHGQVVLKAKMELYHLLDEGESFTLAVLLQSLHKFLQSFSNVDDITGEEEEYRYYIQGLMERRNQNDMEKFWKDAMKFIDIYKQRGVQSEDLNHTNYWGTRQQLLAGKVIADHVDKSYGSLDPIFGILLCPVAGRAGPGDSGIVHNILFDDDGPLAYHSAAHDAFGYLITHHDVGPGYNYLGACGEVLDASRCMSGQISGLLFWKDVLKTDKTDYKYAVT